MKTIPVIILLLLIFTSCNSVEKRTNERFERKYRSYLMCPDTVKKRIIDFVSRGASSTKIIDTTPGLVFLEEPLNEEQTNRYSIFDSAKANGKFVDANERLFIYISGDSLNTKVDIKSFITCNVSILRSDFKSYDMVNKTIECASTGVHENEILNSVGN